MRTAFLGTSAFAATVLERLAATDHRPVIVVTRPDRPRGRGRKLTPPPVADAARALGIDVLQPETVNDEAAGEAFAQHAPDTLIVCAFGAMIRDPLLSSAPILNVHPSLLPRWRGAAPVERAIMAGDAETGVCIMQLTAGLDSGPVCLREAIPIGERDDYGTLAPRLAELGARLLIEALDTAPPFTEQDEDGVTYAEKIEAEDRRLDPRAAGAVRLDRIVRALHPHIGAQLELPGDTLLGVQEARPVAGPDGDPLAPGELAVRDRAVLLGTTDGALELLTVQPPGKRPMPAADWARGHVRDGRA